MRSIYFTVLLAFIFGVGTQISAQVSNMQSGRTKVSTKKSKIRFNGLYCEPNIGGRICLRFYEDGLVLAVALDISVTDKQLAKKVPNWFRRDSGNNVGKGKYSIRKNEITFTESALYPENEGREVRVDYTGKN